MNYKVFAFGCRNCGRILDNKLVEEHTIVYCPKCSNTMNRLVSTYKHGETLVDKSFPGINKPIAKLKSLCRILDMRKK